MIIKISKQYKEKLDYIKSNLSTYKIVNLFGELYVITEDVRGNDFGIDIENKNSYTFASKAIRDKSIVSKFSIGEGVTIIGGPCAVENEEQIFQTAKEISRLGVRFLRGGAYKPRTSPYSFQGLGEEGLKLLKEASEKYNLHIVTECTSVRHIDKVAEVSSIIQVGTRNMQNYELLKELAKTKKPII